MRTRKAKGGDEGKSQSGITGKEYRHKCTGVMQRDKGKSSTEKEEGRKEEGCSKGDMRVFPFPFYNQGRRVVDQQCY